MLIVTSPKERQLIEIYRCVPYTLTTIVVAMWQGNEQSRRVVPIPEHVSQDTVMATPSAVIVVPRDATRHHLLR
jgi:hypothetical protein